MTFKSTICFILAIPLFCAQRGVAQFDPAISFSFSKGQKVLLIGIQSDMSTISLALERKMKEQFTRSKSFRIVDKETKADFLFIIVVDPSSPELDEIALVVLPEVYKQFRSELAELRRAAIWQLEGHYKAHRNAALLTSTLGLSSIFHRPSVSQDLVKRFHQEVLSKK